MAKIILLGENEDELVLIRRGRGFITEDHTAPLGRRVFKFSKESAKACVWSRKVAKQLVEYYRWTDFELVPIPPEMVRKYQQKPEA